MISNIGRYIATTGFNPAVYRYDNKGNVIVDSTSSKDTLAYDQLNRLVSINGGAKGRYYYDGEGKRVRKDYLTHKTVYLYDQWGNLIEETDTTGAFICDYVWASGRLISKIYVETSIPGPRSAESGGGGSGPPPEQKQYIYYYHLDHLGTPLALTGNNQVITWLADLLPFGEIYNELITSPTNEIRFPGQYHDRETGLYYNYFRHYNPRTGRYITPDPIGLEGGINLFAYVNNPLTWIDPFGLQDISTPWTVGWEWLSGARRKTHVFVPGDPFLELLKKHSHIQRVRNAVVARLEKCEKNIPTAYMSYELSGIQGVPKYIIDYSNLLTFGLTGNLAVTYLGSYDLQYSVTNVNWGTGAATLNISVMNISSISSATHPPIIGYTDFWNKYIGDPLNNLFPTGPLSQTIQYFNWSEPISFNPCKCR